MLAEARAGLERLSPADALAAAEAGDAVLVDIRESDKRDEEGRIPGAVEIDRGVLEWRCDPQSQWRGERVSHPSPRVGLVCNEGYPSSLAAADPPRPGGPPPAHLRGGVPPRP